MTRRKAKILAAVLIALCQLSSMATTIHAEAVYIIPPAAASGTSELKLHSVKSPGAIIPKPSCTSGDPYIFVYPVYMAGGVTTSIYAMTGVSTFATDNGNGTWTIRAQVKDARDALWEHPLAIQTIVQVWCCANADCS